MEHLSSVIEKLLVKRGIEKPVKRYQVFSDWEVIVGEKIAAVTTPERIDKDRLIVRVKSDVWRNELLFHKGVIQKKIEARLGRSEINDIIFI